MPGVIGEPFVLSGTATTTPVRVAIVNPRGRATFARRLVIRNEAAGGGSNLMVNLGGSAFVSIPPQMAQIFDGVITAVVVQSSATTAAYSIVATTA